MTSIFEDLFPKDLYQSYILEGDPNPIANELLKFLEARGEIESQSPDVLCQMYESFTMDNSGQIKEWHSQLGVSKGKKVCIIATKFINREAEQALLKIIEEPGVNTHFFIVVPDSSLLLETILSRTQLIKIKSPENEKDLEIQKTVKSFISSSPKDRIDIIANIIKENKDEENSGQLRYYATQLVNGIESTIYPKFKNNINDKNIKFILEELKKSREYLSTPGASVKMILEHLALVI